MIFHFLYRHIANYQLPLVENYFHQLSGSCFTDPYVIPLCLCYLCRFDCRLSYLLRDSRPTFE